MGTDGTAVPDELLRSALQFALTVAAAARAKRPAEHTPAALRPYLRLKALPALSLAVVRAAVEGDVAFREHVGALAREGVVDALGLMWLRRPEGWSDQLDQLVLAAPRSTGSKDAKRREAAEAAAERARREVVEAQKVVDRAHAARAEVETERDTLRAVNERLRQQLKEAQSVAKRRGSDDAALSMVREQLAAALEARDAALEARDVALMQRAAQHGGTVDVDRVRALLGDALLALGEHRRAARAPIAVPGRANGDAEATAEHIARVPDVLLLVDGYNVAKLGWPKLTLEQQRERCIAGAEQLARRWGTDIHVVFDGADVVGGNTATRRLVRVSFSRSGVIADDVLRAEVRSTDVSRPVAVVTDDKAIIRDVRAMGANHVPSAAFLALAKR